MADRSLKVEIVPKYTDEEGSELHFSEALCERELDLETADVQPHRERLGVVPSIMASPSLGTGHTAAGSAAVLSAPTARSGLEWNNKACSGWQPSAGH